MFGINYYAHVGAKRLDIYYSAQGAEVMMTAPLVLLSNILNLIYLYLSPKGARIINLALKGLGEDKKVNKAPRVRNQVVKKKIRNL